MEIGNNIRDGIKPVLKVKDESLDTNLQGDLHLSLQRAEGSLAWALLHIFQNKYLALESYFFSKEEEDAVTEQIKNYAWYKNVTSVSLAWVTDKATLVPEPLYDEKTKATYSAFNFDVAEKPLVFSNRLKGAGCYAVFALQAERAERYKKTFPGIKFMHCGVPLIESVLLDNKNETAEKAVLNIRKKKFELLIARGTSLLYYNTFAFSATEDVIYFLLFTLEQLKLNPETIEVKLFGEIEKNDPLYAIIHKYIRRLHFGARNSRFDYSYRFSEISEHACYSLFSQYP